jgi:hypothetical protein
MAIPAIQTGNVVPGANLLGADERGVNETHIGFVDLPSGRVRAYIKVLGGRQLINELVATTLGRCLGLSIPEGLLVRARPSDLADSAVLAAHGAEAMLFASRETCAPDLKRRIKDEGAGAIAALLNDWKDWASCMTFDEWIANADRHEGNILFGGPGDIWLIDHSHAFTGPNWNPQDLLPNGIWGNQIAAERIPALAFSERIEAKKWVAELIPTLSAVDCQSVFAASMAAALMLPPDAAALQSFVSSRVSHLYDILSHRLGIPNITGLP